MQTIRWGILGCGDVTEQKSGPAFQKVEGSALVAVMRRTRDRAADYARRHGVPRFYDRAEDLIHDPEVDAVYVAAPPGAHLDLALAVAAAGKPAYVEKPMARTHAECRRMIDAFAAKGIPLFIAYYRRALPRSIRVRTLIEEGRIGAPVSLSYRYTAPRTRIASGWRLDPEQSGGGLFVDIGSHALDLFDWLLGPLEDVSGSAARRSPVPGAVEDVVTMRFRAGAVPGAAVWDFAGMGPHVDHAEIGGTEGVLRFPVFGDGAIVLVSPSGAEERFTPPGPEHIAQPLIQTVVDALRGRGTCPSTGESAARTSRVIDEVLAGFYGGRGDGFWRLKGAGVWGR